MSAFGLRWLWRSLREMLIEGSLSVASATLVSALVFCLVSVSSNVQRQLGGSLKAYGAQLVVLPREASMPVGLDHIAIGEVPQGGVMDIQRFEAILADPAVEPITYVPGLVQRIRRGDREIQAVGYPLSDLRSMNPSWKVTPGWPDDPDHALVGADLAQRLKITPGSEIEIEAGPLRRKVIVGAVVETGGEEDGLAFLPLELLQEWTGRTGEVSLILVRADPGRGDVEKIARTIEKALPEVEVRTRLQVSKSEADLLRAVIRLLALVTLAVIPAAGMTLASTTGILLFNRRREIGLFMALGATRRRILLFLLSVAGIHALVGGAMGCLLGWAAAEWVAQHAFEASIAPTLWAFLSAVLIPLLISTAITAQPAWKALELSPSVVLREL